MRLSDLLAVDPWSALGVLAAAAAYAAGVDRLARRGRPHPALRRATVAVAAGGWAVLALAVLGPGDVLAHAFMTAHMAQHLALVLVAPPLLLVGRVPEVVVAGLPRRGRAAATWVLGRARRAARDRPWLPGGALAAVLGAMWLWHAPPLYDLALRHDGVHLAEHATLVTAAIAFWSVVVHPRRAPAWGPPLLLLGLTIGGGLLAAVLAFAPSLYDAHPARFGGLVVDAVDDQQAAGALWWVAGGVVLLGAAVRTFLRWFDGPHPR